MASNNPNQTAVRAILDALAEWKAGRYNKIPRTDGSELAPIIQELNELSAFLSIKSTEGAESPQHSSTKILRTTMLKASATIGTLGPILAVFVPHFLFVTQRPGLLVAGGVCTIFSAVNYLYYEANKNLKTAANVSSAVILFSFTVGVFFSGGVHSIVAPFFPLFPPLFVALTGFKSGMRATIYLVLLAFVFEFLENAGVIASENIVLSPIPIAMEIAISLSFVGAIVCLFELIRERNESSLIASNENLRVTQKQLSSQRQLAEERQNWLQLIADHVPGTVSRVEKDGRYSYANKTYLDWFGISPQDVIGKTHAQVLPGPTYENSKAAIQRALDGEAIQFETQLTLPSGRTPWVQVNFIPYVEPGGTTNGFFTVGYDVSKIKNSERLIKEEKSRYESLVNGINQSAIVALTDREGNITAILREVAFFF